MKPVRPLLTIAAAAAGAGIYASFAKSMAAAHRRLEGRSQVVASSFGDVEYAEMGEGEPVLVVHGASGGFDQGLDMTGALAERGHRLIALSRFGYLRSDLPEAATVAKQADAFAELLDALAVEKAVVVGISAGAWSCLEFAVRHPDRCRALALLVPASALPPGTAIRGGVVAKAIFNSNFVAWTATKAWPILPRALTGSMLGTDAAVVAAAEPGEQARVRQILDHLLPISVRTRGMGFDVATAVAPEPCAIEMIACPVLAISAEDDAFGTAPRARFIAGAVTDGRTVIFPTGGHALVGRYAEALDTVAGFIAGLKASGGNRR